MLIDKSVQICSIIHRNSSNAPVKKKERDVQQMTSLELFGLLGGVGLFLY